MSITETDLNRLRKLIGVMRAPGNDNSREYIDRLEDELGQAEIVTPQSIPKDVITMRSRVRLLDVDSGKERKATLPVKACKCPLTLSGLQKRWVPMARTGMHFCAPWEWHAVQRPGG
ncbi:MAG: hypothetical protein ACRERE_12000 [Candidatus Entotheonellia bacterium]